MFINKKQIKKNLVLHSIPVVLSIIILIWAMRIWGRDLGIPFIYNGDALAASVLIKSIIDKGWYLSNDYVGAPFALDWHDYPITDSFHFLLIKILSIFSFLSLTSGYGLVTNLFFLLGFPLTTLTSFYVFKQLKISNGLSVVFSILYAFQPYHFYRGASHLFLSGYYMVPLATLIVLWIWSDGSIFFAKDEKTGLYRLNLKTSQSIFTFIVCVITGSTGVYYAFFSCFFAVVAGASKFLQERVKYSLVSALIIVTLISSSVLLNVAPSLVYWHNHGSNPEIAARQPLEADVFGLKTVHLILPVDNHRIPWLRDIKEKYTNANFPLNTENTFASLGIIGSLGFLGLLALPLFGLLSQNYPSKIFNYLSTLNLSAVLLASIGGFGSLFNLFVSPQIRAYNRISIFIAFFSLLAVAMFIEKNITRSSLIKKRGISLVLVLILSIGIIDQTPKFFAPSYKNIKEKFRSDKIFVKGIEKQLLPNSMVFQLPYVGFPEAESPSPNQPDAYALFRGYLQSEDLKWSFGAMRGRNGNWHEWVSKKPLDELLTIISAVGFKGIHIDRTGYLDTAKQIEAELKQKLGIEPLASPMGDFVFFNMEKFNSLYRKKYSNQEMQTHKEAALKPPVVKVEWRQGFYPLESGASAEWRWASNTAILKVINPINTSRNVKFDMLLTTGKTGKSKLLIESDLFKDSIDISEQPLKLTKTISVPPGKHTIKFTSNAEPLDSPGDTRSLVFTVTNFQITENNNVNWQEISKNLLISTNNTKNSNNGKA